MLERSDGVEEMGEGVGVGVVDCDGMGEAVGVGGLGRSDGVEEMG